MHAHAHAPTTSKRARAEEQLIGPMGIEEYNNYNNISSVL